MLKIRLRINKKINNNKNKMKKMEELKMSRKEDYASKIKVRGFGCIAITTR